LHLSPAARTARAPNKNDWGIQENMDAKKLTGVMIAFVLAASIIATAPPGVLALTDVALIGALYVIRRRRAGVARR
jgi:hypothetical protein